MSNVNFFLNRQSARFKNRIFFVQRTTLVFTLLPLTKFLTSNSRPDFDVEPIPSPLEGFSKLGPVLETSSDFQQVGLNIRSECGLSDENVEGERRLVRR